MAESTPPTGRPARRAGSLQARLVMTVLGVVSAVWLAAAAMTAFDAREEIDELLDGHLAQAAALLVAQQSRQIEHAARHPDAAETVAAGPSDVGVEDRGDVGGTGRNDRERRDHRDRPGDSHADDDEDERHRGLHAPLLHPYARRSVFQVFHAGRLVLRSANAPLTPMLAADASAHDGARTVMLTLAEDEGDARAAGSRAAADLEAAAWRVFAARTEHPDLQVFVGERLQSRHDILRAVLRGVLGPLLLALPLLAVSTWWAIRRGMAPLRRLGQVLAQRRPQDLAPVAVVGTPAEMQPMLAALNALFERIAQLLAAERRFTADAAHELRTPIAAIRTQAQVALGEADDALRRHALRETLAGCDRAGHLVEQLLTLSRLESTGGATATPVDLRPLARQVIGELAPQALQRRQAIELDAPDAAVVPGNAVLLAVLLRNLVDNAIRYSPDEATIEVHLRSLTGGVTLQVEDSGPGLTEADLARLGERFFRVLGSGRSGSGLGWSIVRRIAAAHRAAVHAGRSSRLGGLAVTVDFPVTPPPV